MSLTSVLAIIGTATGTLSLAIQAIAAARDRPKLRLNVGFTTPLGARPEAWIDVHNEGSRPTTVREIGFYAGPWQFETSEALRATGFFKTPLATSLNSWRPGARYGHAVFRTP